MKANKELPCIFLSIILTTIFSSMIGYVATLGQSPEKVLTVTVIAGIIGFLAIPVMTIILIIVIRRK